MKKTIEKHRVDGVFVLLLITMFTACILLVLFTGARSYSTLTKRDEAAYDQRICVQYVTAKVRHADAANAVYVGNFSGGRLPQGDTLILTEQYGGQTYYTRVYYYGGYVRELFTENMNGFTKADGVPVVAATGLSFSCGEKTGLLNVLAQDANGRQSSVTLSLRSGKGAAS